MENLDLVYQKTSDSQSPTHFRLAEHGSRQAIKARSDHSNRVVSPSRGFSNNMQQEAPAPNRPICHEVQQVASVCVTGTGSPGHSSGFTQSALGGSGCKRLPTSSHIGQSGGKVAKLRMQENHSDCSGMAQHALVLRSGGYVQPNSTESTQSALPFDTALQQSRSRASLRQWQQELRLLKGDQPDQSMRQSGPFLQSGASLIRWTSWHPL